MRYRERERCEVVIDERKREIKGKIGTYFMEVNYMERERLIKKLKDSDRSG